MASHPPAREPAFPAKFLRALHLGQVSAQYGQAAFVLLATVAAIEDAIPGNPEHVQRHLAPLAAECGFGSKQTLITTIRRLAGSGWLEYQPGTSYAACKFRVEIPPELHQAVGLRYKNWTATKPELDSNNVAYIATSTSTSKDPPAPTGETTNGRPKRRPPGPDRSEAIDAVWDAYRQLHPRATLSPERRKLIARRLADGFDVATLQRAIEGNHLDPFCSGQNDSGAKYHDIKLILRDGDHIERYAALVPCADCRGRGLVEVVAPSTMKAARQLCGQAGAEQALAEQWRTVPVYCRCSRGTEEARTRRQRGQKHQPPVFDPQRMIPTAQCDSAADLLLIYGWVRDEKHTDE